MAREDNFRGVIDLIRKKAIYYIDDLGTQSEEKDIPDDLKELADEYRTKLLEVVAEQDDELMMKYLEGDELTEQEIKAAIRKATIETRIIPVMCGSSYKNKGVQPLLDAVVDYLPSPVDIPPVEGTIPDSDEKIVRHSSADEPLSILTFKVMIDPYVGKTGVCADILGNFESRFVCV